MAECRSDCYGAVRVTMSKGWLYSILRRHTAIWWGDTMARELYPSAPPPGMPPALEDVIVVDAAPRDRATRLQQGNLIREGLLRRKCGAKPVSCGAVHILRWPYTRNYSFGHIPGNSLNAASAQNWTYAEGRADSKMEISHHFFCLFFLLYVRNK